MSGDMFFVITRDHQILDVFKTLSEARDRLHAVPAAQYAARLDGAVLAYMSREGQTWRPISRVPPELKKLFRAYSGVCQCDETEPEQVEDVEDIPVLYPPAEILTEVSSAL